MLSSKSRSQNPGRMDTIIKYNSSLTSKIKTVTPKPVVEKPVNSSPQTPEPKPTTNSTIETKVPKFQEVKPVETKPVETKPVKTYKYQTNPQPAYSPPVVQEKPKPKFTISESVEVTENGVTTIETAEEVLFLV
jgi:hypothetical protein